MDDTTLRQAALFGPEFVAELLTYERIIRDVTEQVLTQQGIPPHLWPASQEGPRHALPSP